MIKILFFLSVFLIGDQILSQSSKIIENAHCEEITGPDGKTYSTFGEGSCPYGSKKTYGQRIYCPSGNVNLPPECASKRFDAINNIFDNIYDGIIQIGEAWGQKIYKEHTERITKHNEMIVKDSYDSLAKEEKYIKKIISEPKGLDTYIQKVGIPMISKKGGYYADCIIPHFDFEKNIIGGWTHFIFKDQPICKLQKYSKYIKEKIYYPSRWNGSSKNNNPPVSNGYRLSIKENKFSLCHFAFGSAFACARKRNSEELSYKTGFVTDNDIPFAHIVYLGKFGDIFKFNLITNNGESEFNLLSSGSEINFNGAKVEIISLNKAFVEYRIINYFE